MCVFGVGEGGRPLIRGRVIVCIASAWDYDPTSKHHVMKLLSRENEIIWVNYHGTRRPGVRITDLKSAFVALRRFAGGVRRITPQMVQITPFVFPGASRRPLVRLSQALLVRQIAQAVRTVDPKRRKPLQVWSFAPDVGDLVGRFREECFVYYCVDEYAQFENLDRVRIEACEEHLLRDADVIITTSQPLYESRQERRPDTVLVRHGVDYEHFSRACRLQLPVPQDIADLSGPIFGFFGLIHHWVDIELLARVAELRPAYSFVLLGAAHTDTSMLRRIPNVRLLGRRPYAELPAYCAAFDAGLLFFRRTAMTRNVNPIKLYEYLAAGLPVISTSIPETARMAGPVRLADTPEDFADACDQVVQNTERHSPAETSKLVETETWADRVETLSDIILRRVRGTYQAPRLRFIPAADAADAALGGEPASTAPSCVGL